MLSSIQKRASKPIVSGFEKVLVPALAVGTALTIDQLIGAHSNASRRPNPEFHTARPRGARHTLGVLPGCQSNGQLVYDRFQARAPGSRLAVADYPEHGFDVEQICEGLAKKLIKLRAERPSLVCQSMGGMVVTHFLEYADQMGVAEKVGGFNTIVLDSSPYDGTDVRDHYQHLIDAASATRNSWAVDAVKRLVMKPSHATHRNTHLDTIYSQGAFINSAHPASPAPAIVDTVFYIHGPSDGVIATDLAAPKYEAHFVHANFHGLLDESREAHAHTAATEAQIDFLLSHAGVLRPSLPVAA